MWECIGHSHQKWLDGLDDCKQGLLEQELSLTEILDGHNTHGRLLVSSEWFKHLKAQKIAKKMCESVVVMQNEKMILSGSPLVQL